MRITFNTQNYLPQTKYSGTNNISHDILFHKDNKCVENPYKTVPVGYKYNANISFGEYK